MKPTSNGTKIRKITKRARKDDIHEAHSKGDLNQVKTKKTVLGERKLKKLQKELEKMTYEAEKAILNTKRK